MTNKRRKEILLYTFETLHAREGSGPTLDRDKAQTFVGPYVILSQTAMNYALFWINLAPLTDGPTYALRSH